MTALVKYLHGFVKEVEPTMDEWFQAIQFLTKPAAKRYRPAAFPKVEDPNAQSYRNEYFKLERQKIL
jgi:hypothetical protein